MKRISIVGFGRFGQTLYRLVKDDFIITIYDVNEIGSGELCLSRATTVAQDVGEVYESDVVFYAVPIASFEGVIAAHQRYFRPGQLLIDVLSVKQHAARVFEAQIANSQTQAMLTHPMFGPDSSQGGFVGLPIIINQFRSSEVNYRFWRDYFQRQGLDVIEMSPEEHDRLAANSQGLTHFVGRLLDEFNLQPTSIDSLGAKRLQQVKEQTCNDTWQLFADLQRYNPYTRPMRIKLGAAYDKLYNRLLPKQIDPRRVTYGIQGGPGSYNEEAIRYYLKRAGVEEYNLEYLQTSERVLRALHEGSIDRGQLALHNSVGGVIDESIQAMARYKFNIVDQFSIKISHALMIRGDAQLAEVDTIMTHPQVFAQCQHTLAQKYPQLKRVAGEGELIDQTTVARDLTAGNLPRHIATMGSQSLAALHGLRIVEDNLQDASENYTSFIQVART